MTAEAPEAAPLVFLSHASEDKESFAEPLGRALARLGIQPWLDKWEIKPGDSLVQKIFDEGLARSQAVVVVISKDSVTKPWVRDELDSATVSRIQRGTKLIPVRLDDVEVPEALRHLAWDNAERSSQSVEQTAARIADAVHGRELRPVVAARPAYIANSVGIPGLSAADSSLLLEIIKDAMDQSEAQFLSWQRIKSKAEGIGLSSSVLEESLHALKEQYYVDITIMASGEVQHLELSMSGFSAGIAAVVPEIDEINRRLTAVLVNDPPSGPDAIAVMADASGAERLVVDMFLRDLEWRGLVKINRFAGGGASIWEISPTLRRHLNQP